MTAWGTFGSPESARAAGEVTSVNAQTGDVVLTAQDVGALSRADYDGFVTVANPESFPGLDPSGAAECSDAMQAALSAVAPGGTLFIPPGRYRMGKSLEAPANITISAAHGQAVLVRDGHNGIQLRAYGSHSAPVPITGQVVTEQIEVDGVATGVTRITVATQQSWVPGDLVKLLGDDEIPGARARPGASSVPRIGEYMRVLAVSGRSLTLSGQPIEDYRTNVRVARLDDKTITVVGLAFDVSDATYAINTTPECTIRCDSLRAPHLVGVRIIRAVGIGIQMRSCVGYHIENADLGNAVNRPAASVFGYGIHDVGSSGGVIVGGVARFVRHGYSDKSTETTANSPYPSFYGRTFFAKVVAMEVAHPSGSAFDTHHESYGVSFEGCVARVTTSSGFALRGSGHRVVGCAVYGGDVALKVFTEVGGGVGTGESREIYVSNFLAEGSRVALQTSIRESSHVRQGIQDERQNLTVDGIVARGVARFAVFTNSRVRVRNFEAVARDLPMFVFVQNTNSRLEISGGVFDFEAVARVENNRNRIFRSSASTPSPYSLVIMRDVRVKASSFFATQCAIGPFETDANTDIDARVEMERPFPVMPGPIADTARCTFGWSTLVVNDSSRASLSSSGSVTVDNAGLTAPMNAITRAPDSNLVLLANLSDGTSRVLGKLGKARAIGQRLTILVASTRNDAVLTVRSGSNYGTSLNGVTSRDLRAGGQLHLVWTGTSWRELSV
ncbi:putative dehydrogenase [Microbacterium sp. TS-1]|uniref:putative dehydrogenase n=1 Tax=Microbacterium sp. TS-1 TaxID=1344956 RepID=UPI00038F4B4A|nr:putative dehydrogenase [Microbacterium sp. TS-1]GAD35038.1 putative dehydrogenase [Microbacterium sp. TS-1]